MENLTTTNILLMLLGLLLQILVTVKGAIKDKNFSFGFWVKDNWIEVPISIICAVCGLLFGKDIIELFGVKAPDGAPLYLVHAFICGYGGREIIFRVLEFIKPKK